MKKIILAAAAVCIAVGMTNCKKEDKTPTQVKDAEVVSPITPGESITETVGAVVETSDVDGQVVAEGDGVATENVVVNSDGSTPAPAAAQSSAE